MLSKKFWLGTTTVAIFLTALSLFFAIQKVQATPTAFKVSPICSTQGLSATVFSTTSPSYMQAGLATTTATCPMMIAGGGSGTELYDEATLFIQYAGSSTAATLNFEIQDSYNGVDWYPRSLSWNTENTQASSSPSIGAIQVYTWTFSSSTQNKNGLTNANSATTTRVIALPVQAPYIRAVFTVPVGSTNGSVWAVFAGTSLNP